MYLAENGCSSEEQEEPLDPVLLIHYEVVNSLDGEKHDVGQMPHVGQAGHAQPAVLLVAPYIRQI